MTLDRVAIAGLTALLLVQGGCAAGATAERTSIGERRQVRGGAECPQPSAAPRLWLEGCSVRVRGRVAREPAQHLIGHVEGKHDGYFDLEDGSQVVVYVGASPPVCPGPLVLEGRVLEVRGPPKHLGRKTKAESTQRESEIDVETMRCEDP